MFINPLFSFHVTFYNFLSSARKQTFSSVNCQYQLRNVNVFAYIYRSLSPTWYSGICVMGRPSHCLSVVCNEASLRGLLMLLADFRMPSRTGSEAVSKYIYVSERPSIRQLIYYISSVSFPAQKSLPPFFSNCPLPSIPEKSSISIIFYDEHSPYANCVTSLPYIRQLLTRFPIAPFITHITGITDYQAHYTSSQSAK